MASTCWTEDKTSTVIEAWGQRYLYRNQGSLKQKDWQLIANVVNSVHDHCNKSHKNPIQCKNKIDIVKKKYKSEKTLVDHSIRVLSSSWRFYSKVEYYWFGEVNSPPREMSLNNGKDRMVGNDSIFERNCWDGLMCLTNAIKGFREMYEGVEKKKMEQMIEMEKRRMEFAKDMENERMKTFLYILDNNRANDVTLEEFLRVERGGSDSDRGIASGSGGLDVMSPVVGGDREGPSLLPGIVVSVRRASEYSIGVIREVLPDGSCVVALGFTGNGEVIIALPYEVDALTPREDERIKIIGGPQRGATGNLVGFSGKDGIVRFDDTPGVKILSMDIIAKLVQT